MLKFLNVVFQVFGEDPCLGSGGEKGELCGAALGQEERPNGSSDTLERTTIG